MLTHKLRLIVASFCLFALTAALVVGILPPQSSSAAGPSGAERYTWKTKTTIEAKNGNYKGTYTLTATSETSDTFRGAAETDTKDSTGENCGVAVTLKVGPTNDQGTVTFEYTKITSVGPCRVNATPPLKDPGLDKAVNIGGDTSIGGERTPEEETEGLAGSNQKIDDECLEGVGNISPISWMGCAVLNILDDALNKLNVEIHKLLFVEKAIPNGVEGSWAVFRNLAYIVLVPMMLFMVIGTAINIGPFDPYTVKKALPRMFFAVIFIALSFELCSFLINISNIVGNGVGNLITNLSPHQATIDGVDQAGSVGGGIIAAGTLYALAGGITWGVVGSLGLVMVVGLLIAFFILILRQVLIVMLIVLAPIAILVWIFPGNDKLWGVWKGTFTAMLMMYPLISILIASGAFFAGAVNAGDVAGGGRITTLIALIGYVAPFFLIPATFKYGMGIFGNLAGMVNDRGRGFFDRQRKFREGSRAAGRQKAFEGKRFAGGTNTNFRGKLNRWTGAGLNAPGAVLSSGNTFKPNQWAAATRTAMGSNNQAAIERVMKENQDYQTWIGNDTLNKAAAESNNAQQLRDNLVRNYGYREGSQQLDDAVSSVEKVRRGMGSDAFKQMTTLNAIAGGTAYKTAGQMAAAIGSAAGNDDNARAWLVAKGRSAAQNAGRLDQAGMGFSDLYNEAGQFAQLNNRGTLGNYNDENNDLVQASTARLTDAVYESQGGSAMIHSSLKPESTRQMSRAALRHVERAVQGGDARVAAQSLASLAATHDSLQASSPEQARAWADGVMNERLDVGSLPPELREKLAPAIGSSTPVLDPSGKPVTRAETRTKVIKRTDAATGKVTEQTTQETVQVPVMAPGSKREITYLDAINALQASNDTDFLEMRREYSNRFAAERNAQPAPGTDPTAPPAAPFARP